MATAGVPHRPRAARCTLLLCSNTGDSLALVHFSFQFDPRQILPEAKVSVGPQARPFDCARSERCLYPVESRQIVPARTSSGPNTWQYSLIQGLFTFPVWVEAISGCG
jgi:hypothetical protein